MKIRLLILLSSIALFLASCRNDNCESSTITYRISNTDFASWKDLVKIKEAVVLKADVPLSFPQKCLVSANRIAFWDSRAKTVYLFNANGTFISQVGERGNAKNEYTQIRDIAFSPDSSIIKVLDDSGILNYSAEDGHFLGAEKIKSDISKSVWKFLPIDENHYLFFSEGENTIVEYETVGGNAKVTGLRKKECFPYITEHFYEYNGKYRIISDFGDFYVDDFNNNTLTKKYIFDLGSKALPKEKKPQSFVELERVNNAPEYQKCIGSAFETEQWIYISVVGLDLKCYDVFINKKTNNIIAGSTSDLFYFGTCGNDLWAMPYPDSLEEGTYLYETLKDDIKADLKSPILLKMEINETNL